MKKSSYGMAFLLFLLVTLFSFSAEAAWKESGSGYVYYTDQGVKCTTKWLADVQCGFVTIDGVCYCIKKDGTKYTGFLTSNGKKYYITKKGVLLKDKWLVISGKRYRSTEDGSLLISTFKKINGSYYCFDKNGVRITGFKKVNGKTRYFTKKNGKMLCSCALSLSGERYCFSKYGVMYTKKWVGRYYYGSDGKAVKSSWVGKRYLDDSGKYCTGLKKIGSVYYYFDTSTGYKVVSQTKTVDGLKYTFDSEGKCSGPSTSGYESEVATDPVVSDEILLAAIIYCEAGNQPYYGQLAVGIVITNRIASPLFPNSLKAVVYQDQQFQPSRDGSLSRALNNQSLITDSAKKAGAEAVKMYKAKKYTVTTDAGKKVDLEGYLFFMTAASYKSLGLSASYVQLKDHVFFKYWQ